MSKYSKKEKNNHNDKKILVFGDSFSNTFKSFKDPNIKVFKYKGATAKGLTKIDNVNSQDIIKHINEYNKYNEKGCLIFVFGNVDLHFSYYYNLLLQKPFDMKEIIKLYVQFVASLEVNKNIKKYICNIYPSAVLNTNVPGQLWNYNIFTKKFIKENEDLILEHSNDKLRLERLNNANTFLKEECIKNNISFIDINSDIMKDNTVKSEFIDPGIYNIHLRYEPQLKYLKKKITKCKIINKCSVNASKKYKEKKILMLKKKPVY
jgi:hypothetical protein